eukprot:3062687-Amphidinium_carterae.1
MLELISKCGHSVAPDAADLRRHCSVSLLIAELRHSCLRKSLDAVTPTECHCSQEGAQTSASLKCLPLRLDT